nr:MAG TPA: hypothetical protein [Caudoviricetes sp.]
MNKYKAQHLQRLSKYQVCNMFLLLQLLKLLRE